MGLELKQVHPRGCSELQKIFGTQHEQEKVTQKALNPFPGDYDPDLDTMDVLKDDQATYFQSQIGILRWMVELGRVDIATEVSLLSSMLHFPGRATWK